MSTIIHTSELELGDVYVTYSSMGRDRAGEAQVRKVTGRRMMNVIESYVILETHALDGTRRGEISIRRDLPVERLDELNGAYELVEIAQAMMPGDHVLFAQHGGKFYA